MSTQDYPYLKDIPLIERMRWEDLDVVLSIAQQSFPQPYSREMFLEEMSLDIAHPMVLKIRQKIIGLLDYWIVQDEIHLITIAIDPQYRQKGFGSLLMGHLETVAIEKQIRKIFLDVRKSNESAIQLYEKFGYLRVGSRKKYYTDNDEDALVMEKKI
ncbi:MAG: ribosomal protein S18-alanine N-acetyltransferase [Deltaproteobacteria bacterium]|nr:ribosomal protein S18-alanine N-acetyltransferase [Deltaproteobacteria bacterium]